MTIAFHHGREAINQTKSTKEYLHSDRDRSKFNSKYCEMPTFIKLLLCAFRHVQDGSLYGFIHLCKTVDLLSSHRIGSNREQSLIFRNIVNDCQIKSF